MQKHEADIIIVGAGIAGICAALELLDAGKKVLLIDRDQKSALGGLAKWSFGGMFFANSPLQKRRGINDSVDLAIKDWFSYAEFGEDDHLAKQWAEKYIHLSTAHGYSWLKGKSIQFFPALNWAERGLNQKGNSVPRFHMVWGTGHELIKQLSRHLLNHPKKQNLQILYQHRVSELLYNSKTVFGVQGVREDNQEPFQAHGDSVVVATGGINGNISKVKEHWDKTLGSPPEIILNGAHKFANGDLHIATEAIGGSVVNLEKQWNYAAGIRHYQPRKEGHGLSLVPCKSALWFNYQGKRFGPTPLVSGTDTRFIVEQICKEKKKYSWQILNVKIAAKEFAISGSELNHDFREKRFLSFVWKSLVAGNKKFVLKMADKCEDIILAHSVEELVGKMNALHGNSEVSLSSVKEAISKYDQDAERGEGNFQDKQLQWIEQFRKFRGDKTRTSKFQKINDRSAFPLIAIRNFILSRKSLGGIETDLSCRVLTSKAKGEQRAIDGLYAIGEAAGFGGGGMHGKRSLEGTFLGGCVITGRVCAKAILGQVLE